MRNGSLSIVYACNESFTGSAALAMSPIGSVFIAVASNVIRSGVGTFIVEKRFLTLTTLLGCSFARADVAAEMFLLMVPT